ncbi:MULTISPECIES: aspartate/glutamate racemase family protein [unclassified Rhizobium]|uniref:aspartate/glutamate racemase family protein n=1 Tax=unclassified Rhizobium TaxID=2613769 RepID=UPI00380EB6B3
MSQKTVGIIGGLGPMATVTFMNSILKFTPADSDRDHLHMIVDCNPKVPDINASVLNTGPSAVAGLVEGARRLEGAGADFIVMVCNAAHQYEAELRRSIAIPFVSMIDETMVKISSEFPGFENVGLLATNGCLQSELYQKQLAGRGLKPVLQKADELERLMRVLARIRGGNLGEEQRTDILALIDALVARGAQTVILGCTEIALVDPASGSAAPLIDPSVTLAEATVELALIEN